MIDETLADLADQVRHRYYGKYRGTVTDVDDSTLRIKANVPSVLGEQVSGWCVACVPYAGDGVGFAFMPEVGAGVWVEFEAGDVSRPIWSGCYWREGETPSGAGQKKKVIATASGISIELDDDAGSITIKDSDSNQVVFDSSGITLTVGAQKVAISSSSVSVNDGALEVM